jgi:Tfp pilus assembly protein PilO
MSKNLKTSGKNVTAAFAGTALLTLVCGGGVIFVMNQRINAERNQASNLEAQVGSSEQVAKRLQATRADYDLTRSKIADLEDSIPQKSYVPTLLQQLQNLATTTHLFVTSIQPGQIITPAPPAATTTTSTSSSNKTKAAATVPYDTMDVSLSLTGTYVDTQKFVYGLTHFPKIISVTGMQMSPVAAPGASTTAAPASVTTNLKLTAFVFPDTDPDSSPAPTSATGVTSASTGIVPAVAAPTPAGAAGRAMQGAVAATRAANASSAAPAHTL